MATYGTQQTDDEGRMVHDHDLEHQPPTTWQKITHNRWVNLVLLLVFLLVLAVVLTCVVIVLVYHRHLILQCGYAEFIALFGLVSLVTIFSVYHLIRIFKFFKRRAQRSVHKGFAAIFDPTLYTDLDNEHLNKENQDDQGDDEFEDDEDEEEEEEVEEESTATKIALLIGKIIVTVLAILGFIALVVFTAVAVPLQQKTLVQWSGNLFVKDSQLKTSPKIVREGSGIVHIEGEADYDTFFAQGLAVAQDRMWQLEYNKRLAAGTLSAIIGSDTLALDRLSRTLNIRARAAQDLALFDQTTLNVIQAYVNGINAYYDTNPTLAPEFYYLKVKEPSKFEPADVVAISKLFAWDLGSNGRLELLRYNLLQRGLTQARIDELIPRFDVNRFSTVLSRKDLNITLTPEEIANLEARQQDDSGFYQPSHINATNLVLTSNLFKTLSYDDQFGHINSNNWVLSGSFTASKKPILSNDPHLKMTAPGQFHLVHLKNKAGIDAIGASLVGVPGIFIGRNDRISWGVNNNEIDGQDYFAMNEAVPGVSYHHGGQVWEYRTRTETIEVAGDSAQTITVKESEFYGPIMNEIWGLQGVPLSLSWTSLHNDTSIVTYTSLLRSSNFTTFVNNLKSAVAGFSYTYADVDGNIGYAVSGKVPIRNQGHTGRYVVIGNGTWDYSSYVDPSQLPAVLNPSSGYIVSANNRITPPGYKYVLTQDYNGLYRAERIKDKLFNVTKFDLDAAKAIQLDVKSSLFADFQQIFENLKGNVSSDYDIWRDKVAKWSGNEELYSQETSVFEMWFAEMGALVKSEIGRRWNNAMFIKNALSNGDVACAAQNKTCLQLAGEAFNNAVQNLEGTYGSIPLWGSDVHEVEFTHGVLSNTLLKCLAGKTVVNIGGTYTVNEGIAEYPTLSSYYGVSYRQLVDMEGDKDLFIIPLGQSGNFLSSGYDDLLSLWRDGNYLDMLRDKYNGAQLVVLSS